MRPSRSERNGSGAIPIPPPTRIAPAAPGFTSTGAEKGLPSGPVITITRIIRKVFRRSGLCAVFDSGPSLIASANTLLLYRPVLYLVGNY